MSKEKSPELLPCPFCSSQDIKFGSRILSIGEDIFIKCQCGAKVQICSEFGQNELIKRWNRRAHEPN